jgi:hypothetical protein
MFVNRTTRPPSIAPVEGRGAETLNGRFWQIEFLGSGPGQESSGRVAFRINRMKKRVTDAGEQTQVCIQKLWVSHLQTSGSRRSCR